MPGFLIKSRTVSTGMVVAVLGLAMALTSSGTANAIANGSPVPDGQFLFSTKLTMTNIPRSDGTTYDSACSAALIASQWIITAGHCFHDVKGNRVSGPTPYATTATVGRTDISQTGGYVLSVTQVLQAPRVDVALGKLASPITDIAPLPLSTNVKAGAILRVTGWGATSSVNPTPATHLQTGQVKVKRVSGSTVLVVGYAPASNTSACLYDSGAPYFSELANGSVALVSVEVDGPACPHSQEETTAGIHRISDWIRQNAV